MPIQEEQLQQKYFKLRHFCQDQYHSVRAYSHQAKATAKAKDQKKNENRSKNKRQTGNKMYAFSFAFVRCEQALTRTEVIIFYSFLLSPIQNSTQTFKVNLRAICNNIHVISMS